MTGMETALLLAGTAVSAIGALQQGRNAQATANANAASLFDAAKSERLTAAENQRRQKRVNLRISGSNRALDPYKMDLLEDSAMEQALVVADIGHAGNIKAIRYENQAYATIRQGAVARQQAFTTAFSQVLMGAGLAYSYGGFGGGATTTPTTVGSPLRITSSPYSTLAPGLRPGPSRWFSSA